MVLMANDPDEDRERVEEKPCPKDCPCGGAGYMAPLPDEGVIQQGAGYHSWANYDGEARSMIGAVPCPWGEKRALEAELALITSSLTCAAKTDEDCNGNIGQSCKRHLAAELARMTTAWESAIRKPSQRTIQLYAQQVAILRDELATERERASKWNEVANETCKTLGQTYGFLDPVKLAGNVLARADAAEAEVERLREVLSAEAAVHSPTCIRCQAVVAALKEHAPALAPVMPCPKCLALVMVFRAGHPGPHTYWQTSEDEERPCTDVHVPEHPCRVCGWMAPVGDPKGPALAERVREQAEKMERENPGGFGKIIDFGREAFKDDPAGPASSPKCPYCKDDPRPPSCPYCRPAPAPEAERCPKGPAGHHALVPGGATRCAYCGAIVNPAPEARKKEATR